MINKFLKNPLNKFIIWLLGIFAICFIGITNVFALETRTIYSGFNSGSLSGAGYYGYGYYNQGGVQSYATAPVNSTISGRSTGFLFYLYESINIQKTYTIKVNFMSVDLLPSVNISNFLISTCTASACNEGAIISIEKQNNNSNSQWIILKFNPSANGSIIKFDSGANGNYMTGVSNFGISSVQIESTNPQQDIINNQTNNTNNIINNNNSNTQDIINNQNQNTQVMTDTITDDNVDSSSWSNFFNNFTTNTFGLTSIITAPLNLIQSLTSTTCTDLQLPLPYLQNKYLTLPCMSSIYSQHFGTFFTLYQTITYGVIAYWVCVRIFNLVKDFKNPDHDEIEVVDL